MKRLISIAVLLFALVAILPIAQKVAVAMPAASTESPSAPAITDEDVRLFPNPVEGELNVQCEKFEIERLMIFGNSGEPVFNSPMAIPQGSRMTINMSSRLPGYYTVKIWAKGEKQPLTYRILKM